MNLRQFSLADKVALGLDQILRSVCHQPKSTGRPYPAEEIKETLVTSDEKKHSAGLMRINHAGEIAAQALYQGQALASRNVFLKNKMRQAAIEEGDHLAWCTRRLQELQDHPSNLTLFWYMGSFAIGFFAGILGDTWSLGFLAETEQQVIQHLDNHLAALAAKDQRSSAILACMQADEARHRDEAQLAGAKTLPKPIKHLMRLLSGVMIKTAYRI